MLVTIALIILALWLLGFVVHIGGGLIHLLLVVGVIMLIIHLLRGRPTTTV
ncbi:MAG TPA: lmo0937 family membrane protein [Candidatus Saccharimonadales bacterium]|nr:lmo0937 family membrane protein [Candidatus Saccharimonadales bacterium]